MGLLGKSFSSKIKSITTLAVSRIVILKNQHKARASYARSDLAQLLNLGHHDPALLRVEQWITEQNILEVFAMIENYCNFLRERAEALETNKECPVELREATSSLIFASSRCGDFPELHKIREILASRLGKEFAHHAVELHKNNRVNSKMIQKLSPKHPTMEIKMKVLKQIAAEIGVTLRLEQDKLNVEGRQDEQDNLNVEGRQDERETRKNSVDDHNREVNIQNNAEKIISCGHLSDRNEERKRHTDTPAAAAEKALELEIKVRPTLSSSSKQDYEVISKSNHAMELKALERREVKTLAWEDFHLSLSLRDNMTTISKNAELISKEHVEEANIEDPMVGELGSAKSFLRDNNDHNSNSDAATENELFKFNEGRVHPSSHAIKWNSQRSQSYPPQNPMARRHVTETRDPTQFQKQIHTHDEHEDWKMMSVRTK
ncbi:hypothetical protein PHAVU_008G005200 [Phaseolus vulgaris]|uniref:IST1-like protein n=1 Tax=Phaseolus vulgaris TaxID=3885 RepID=V7B0U2_PHAVU|nr:hypothetical protein PHAVU_008G005200g [Phaseolus vulgaris]ESW11140.1 hypothetical protein PHAVU_008G005200g [Phaseolus vulgaris]